MTIRTTTWIVGVLCASLGLMRCDDFDGVEFCEVGTTEIVGDFSPEGIAVLQGQAVGFKVVPYRHGGATYKRDTSIRLKTDDPEVLKVEVLDYESPICPGPRSAAWYFVISGKSQGMTILRVYVDDSEREQVPVFVAPPLCDCL